jgi:hypothetical protein
MDQYFQLIHVDPSISSTDADMAQPRAGRQLALMVMVLLAQREAKLWFRKSCLEDHTCHVIIGCWITVKRCDA